MPWNFWRRGSLPTKARRPHRYRPDFETLEARTTPTVFTNATPIRIVDGAAGNPYPSAITVAGLNGTLANLTVTLRNVTHDFSDNIDVLLVGPQGQKNLILISDAGSGANAGVTIVFDDNGSLIDPMETGWANGAANTTVTRRPVNYGAADSFPTPAPNAPYTDPGASAAGTNILTSTFAGTNPNGAWQLFVVDDTNTSSLQGAIQGGWSLDINVLGPDLQITKDDGLAQASPGQQVTYTITVTNPGPLGVVGANVTDMFSPDLLGVNYTAGATGGASGFTSGAGNINDVVNLPAQSTITYKATATISPTAAEAVFNSASVTPPSGTIDPDLTNNTATDMDFLVPAADLAVDVSAVTNNHRVVYTITVRNLGPSDALRVVLNDVLPSQFVFVGQAQVAGPTFALGNSGNQITNTIDLFATGATATFRVFGFAPYCCIVNTATVTSIPVEEGMNTPDQNPGNNSHTLTTLVGSANHRWLTQVYRDIIKREIGPPALRKGLIFLSQPGNPRQLRLRYMQNLLSSLLYQARISHDTFNNLLHQANHNDDCVKALNFLHTGGTREQLHASIYGGREYFVRRGGGTNAGWAAAVFQDIFGRPIDAAGAALINRLLARGLSREQIAQQLLNSAAARAQLVQSWFQQYLRRAPRPAELNRFVQDLGRGVPDEQIIAILVASPEYFNNCNHTGGSALAAHHEHDHVSPGAP